jgi:predicted  nucleic acid-binding Zn-ribbon protein
VSPGETPQPRDTESRATARDTEAAEKLNEEEKESRASIDDLEKRSEKLRKESEARRTKALQLDERRQRLRREVADLEESLNAMRATATAPAERARRATGESRRGTVGHPVSDPDRARAERLRTRLEELRTEIRKIEAEEVEHERAAAELDAQASDLAEEADRLQRRLARDVQQADTRSARKERALLPPQKSR